jgi:hypothetical protein
MSRGKKGILSQSAGAAARRHQKAKKPGEPGFLDTG